jgi:hypothetical protein
MRFLRNAIAAVSPPMPPPMMIARMNGYLARSSISHSIRSTILFATIALGTALFRRPNRMTGTHDLQNHMCANE